MRIVVIGAGGVGGFVGGPLARVGHDVSPRVSGQATPGARSDRPGEITFPGPPAWRHSARRATAEGDRIG